MARGKALVAELRKNPKVRDAEALAAHLGRFRKARKAGLGTKAALKVAKGGGSSKGSSGSKKVGTGGLAERVRSSSAPKSGNKVSVLAKKRPVEDDDPFAEDFGDDEPKSKEDLQRSRMEAKLLADMEKADRQKVYRAIQEQGGLKTREDLREEYAGIPNTFKRRDGLAGDDMADHLARFYPELGIESERDLIDYLAA